MNTPFDDLPAPLADRAASELLIAAPTQRDAALAALIAAHPQHAGALRRLCAELEGAEHLLDVTYPDRATVVPTHVGGHRVVRRLGEGAFGVVFLCAQEHPVVRDVAVKVMRPGVGDARTLQRFAAERQLLASLNHPAITQVFDAGELADGRPFVVMEYVDGAPLRAFCDQHRLACRDRLRLFVELCRGVAHAHARGVVHRDLKPQNVLVAATADGPRPKIIDFGIAKALTARGTGGELRTDSGRVIGTPGYMSPEQAAGRVDEVDERTDVWALGVMLYELLTGDLPWPTSVAERTDEPPRPSTRVSTANSIGDAAVPAAVRRRRAAELRGDLDWITLKALALERNARYASATALLEDVERHLRGEPVSVGPPSASYRLRKLLRRHRVAFAWGTVCALTALLGVGVALGLWDRIVRGDEARLQSIVQAVKLLEQRAARAWGDGAPEGVVRSMLADALALHDRELAAVPDRDDFGALRLGVLTRLATTCFWLGQYRQAVRWADEATQLADGLVARHPPGDGLLEDRATAARELGRAHRMLDERDRARTDSERAVELFTRLHDRDPMRYATRLAGTLVEYGKACRDVDREQELAAQQRAVAIMQQFTAANPDDVDGVQNLVRMHCGLVAAMLARGRIADAEHSLQQAEQVAASPHATDEERALVASRRARLHASKHEPLLAVAAGEQALQLLAPVLLRHPDLQQPRAACVDGHALLCEQYTRLHDAAAAAAHAAAIVAAPVQPGTDDAMVVAETLRGMAWANVARQTRAALVAAEPWLERCIALYEQADVAHVAERRSEVAILRGRVAFDLGHPLPGAQLEALARAAAEQPGWAAEAWLQAARSHRTVFALARAKACLDAVPAAALPSPDRLPRERMLLALAAGEPGEALACARAIVAGEVAATSLAAAALGAWRAGAFASGCGDAATAGAANEVALACCQRVTSDHGELGELASAQARACTVLLTTPSAADLDNVAAELDGWRSRVPASYWDEPFWVALHAAAAGYVGEDEPLRALLQQPRAPVDDVATAASFALRAGGGELAMQALRRACDHGASDRSALRGHPGFASLRDDPAFRALTAAASGQ